MHQVQEAACFASAALRAWEELGRPVEPREVHIGADADLGLQSCSLEVAAALAPSVVICGCLTLAASMSQALRGWSEEGLKVRGKPRLKAQAAPWPEVPESSRAVAACSELPREVHEPDEVATASSAGRALLRCRDLRVEGLTRVQLENLHIVGDSAEEAVRVAEGGRLCMVNCLIQNPRGRGVTARGMGTELVMERCEVSRCSSSGVYLDGTHAPDCSPSRVLPEGTGTPDVAPPPVLLGRLDYCTVCENGNRGVIAYGAGSALGSTEAVLQNCTVEQNGTLDFVGLNGARILLCNSRPTLRPGSWMVERGGDVQERLNN